MVHALGQNRAEGDRGQGSWLLPHCPDLQKGPEGYGRREGSMSGKEQAVLAPLRPSKLCGH